MEKEGKTGFIFASLAGRAIWVSQAIQHNICCLCFAAARLWTRHIVIQQVIVLLLFTFTATTLDGTLKLENGYAEEMNGSRNLMIASCIWLDLCDDLQDTVE